MASVTVSGWFRPWRLREQKCDSKKPSFLLLVSALPPAGAPSTAHPRAMPSRRKVLEPWSLQRDAKEDFFSLPLTTLWQETRHFLPLPMEALCPFGRPFPLQAPRFAARAPGSPIQNELGGKSDQPPSQAGAPATVWSTFRCPPWPQPL